MVSNSDLLVVSHHYNHFVKSQVDELANYYDSITVLVRYNRIASLSNYLPIDRLKPYSAEVRINRENQPDNIRVIGVPLFYLPTSFSRRRLGDRHAKKITKIIEREGISFDIVHSHISWTAGYAGQVVSDEFDVPHVITVHENRQWLESQLTSGNENLYWAWREADSLIRVSEHDTDLLRNYNQNTVCVPNGYEVDRFEPVPKEKARRELGIDADVELLFSLGELINRKGFHNTISVLPEINRVLDQPVEYVIGGHGPNKSEYESQAAELGVRKRLSLPGYIPNDELKYWMSAADLFVFPSYSESFGIVQLEAMACGTPVIAAANGGSEYIVSSEEVGMLIDDPEDHNEFAIAIRDGLERNWSPETISDYANQYTIPKVCEEIVDLHKKLMRSDETGI